MRILVVLLAMSATAFAQDVVPAPPELLIRALEGQRNIALNWHAQAEARISVLQIEIERLRRELDELRKKVQADK